MTDYEYLIKTDFKELEKYQITSGTILRKKHKDLERDSKNLIRFQKSKSSWDNGFVLTTRILDDVVRISSDTNYSWKNIILFSSLSFKSPYFRQSIQYKLELKGERYSCYEQIIDKILETYNEIFIDYLIVKNYFVSEDIPRIYKKEKGRYLMDISDHFSDLVDICKNSPVKPDNYLELLRLESGVIHSRVKFHMINEIPNEVIIMWMSGINYIYEKDKRF